jgi:Gram-negative bacterial TonB protein C-terminal
MKIFFACLFSIALLNPSPSASRAQSQLPDLPKPKNMVAPSIPPLAGLLHVSGNVVVDVKIDTTGKVRTASAVEGHPVLKRATLDAVMHWEFETLSEPTDLRLTFVWPRLLGPAAIVSVQPYGADLVAKIEPPPDTVSWLPKDYEEGKTRCKVHGALLKKDRVEIIYGLMLYKPGYFEAQQKSFPNAQTNAMGGCIVEETRFAIVAYCPKCRKAEARWSRAHRDDNRYSYTGN